MKWSSDKLLLIGLVLIGVTFLFSYSTTGFNENNKLSCSADVKSSLGIVSTSNVKCVVVQSGCLKNPLKSVTGFSLLNSEGDIKFDSGDDYSVQSFSIFKGFETKTYSATLCSSQKDVLVSTFNDAGNLIESKSVRAI